MTRALVALALLAACKGKHDQPATTGSAAGSAAVAHYVVDAKCEAAVKKAASAPLDARPQLLIDGCHVCGDWTPILRWNTPPQEGGPPRAAIEKAMLDCNAYCDPNAKQRFLGTLDAARGTSTRTPWRQLGEVCKDQVSALPDGRFLGGPYFALDRIARAIGNKGGELATTAAAIELPLPPVSTTGVGPVLADVDGVTPKVGEIQITVLGDKIYVGRMPRAHLAAGGVTVELGPNGYPGIETALPKLPEALRYAIGDDASATISLLAPHAMPAQTLVPIVAAAAPIAPLYLAANAIEAPEGWTLAAAIPVALAPTGDSVTVTPEMSVQQLAAAIAQHKGSRVVLRSP
jgi:hypothetical protein